MSKKQSRIFGSGVAVAVLIAGVMLGLVISAAVYQLYFANTGSINQQTSLDMYIDGVFYPNATQIDWGACDPGATYSIKNLTIANTGNTNVTAIMVTSGLPGNWNLQYQRNNTFLQTGQSISGWLNLTIPASASTWPNWGFYVNAG